MKVKKVIFSYGPTINIGGIYFKSGVSLEVEDFKKEDMPEVSKLMKQLYYRTLAQELGLGKALEGKPLKRVAKMLASKLNKIDGNTEG